MLSLCTSSCVTTVMRVELEVKFYHETIQPSWLQSILVLPLSQFSLLRTAERAKK